MSSRPSDSAAAGKFSRCAWPYGTRCRHGKPSFDWAERRLRGAVSVRPVRHWAAGGIATLAAGRSRTCAVHRVVHLLIYKVVDLRQDLLDDRLVRAFEPLFKFIHPCLGGARPCLNDLQLRVRDRLFVVSALQQYLAARLAFLSAVLDAPQRVAKSSEKLKRPRQVPFPAPWRALRLD